MKFVKYLFLFICFCKLHAQNSDSTLTRPSSVQKKDSLVKQKQVSDIIVQILKLKKKDLRDSVEVKVGELFFAVLPGIGYTLQSGLTGLVSANISFYTGHPKTTNISSFVTDIEYSPAYKQTFVPLIFNVWLKDNKLNILGDMRYNKFPQLTYGVGGGQTSEKIEDRVTYSYIKSYLTVFKPVYKNLYVGLGYNLDYHYNVSDKDSGTNFRTYNNNAITSISSGVTANIKYDARINANNPQGGGYCSIAFRYNTTALKSDQNWQGLIIDNRKYFKFKTRRSNILAFWNYNWLTFGKVPYFDLPSTGWDTYANLGRGYIQGRFRGNNLIYLESEYRFGITKNGLFGAVIFVNAQSFNEWPGNKFVHIFPAAGGGLRIKLNKYSKVNFSLDYSVGVKGSQGFFFNIGEVF